MLLELIHPTSGGGPLGIIPGLLVVIYLVITIAIVAYLSKKRDMIGVG